MINAPTCIFTCLGRFQSTVITFNHGVGMEVGRQKEISKLPEKFFLACLLVADFMKSAI